MKSIVLLLSVTCVLVGGSATCTVTSNVQYNGTRLAVTRGGSLADCCDACSKTSTCSVYNWHPVGTAGQETFCELQSANGAATPSNPAQNFSAGIPSTHVLCQDEEDCSLAGDCISGRCVCDGWTHGDHCEQLSLLPVDAERFGYRNASGYNSWGGASVAFGGRHYLFASQMGGKCPLLGHWATVSEVVRLSGNAPNGPFSRVDTVVLPSFAHNVKPVQAPDGMWLLFFIGGANNRTDTCENATRAGAATPSRVSISTTSQAPAIPVPGQTAGPIMVASASRPDAPASAWQLHGPLTDSTSWHSATNPAPLFFANGSVLLAVSRKWTPGGKRTVLMVADSWQGPYRNITHGFNESIPTGEDPDLFRTRRGFFMLNHNSGPGSTRMWFSRNGVTGWRVADGNANAFNATIQFTNGTKVELCQRQRPRVVMADDGMPGWLWTGVMVGSPCPSSDIRPGGWPNPSWTLAQQIGRI